MSTINENSGGKAVRYHLAGCVTGLLLVAVGVWALEPSAEKKVTQLAAQKTAASEVVMQLKPVESEFSPSIGTIENVGPNLNGTNFVLVGWDSGGWKIAPYLGNAHPPRVGERVKWATYRVEARDSSLLNLRPSCLEGVEPTS